MRMYAVNFGHFDSFKAANAARKGFRGGTYVFATGGGYTVRLFSTPREADARRAVERGARNGDVWLDEFDTSGWREG